MLDRLVDLLVRFGMDMLPFVIIEQWNGAVQLRCGKFIKVLSPGIHFKIPFFDSVIECPVITQSDPNYIRRTKYCIKINYQIQSK
jgi:regulator of protease activity HflC (stomatin/prohibitin superfamily)